MNDVHSIIQLRSTAKRDNKINWVSSQRAREQLGLAYPKKNQANLSRLNLNARPEEEKNYLWWWGNSQLTMKEESKNWEKI